jgi:hypothetical protein
MEKILDKDVKPKQQELIMMLKAMIDNQERYL